MLIFFYWSVCSSSRILGDGIMGVRGGIIILASWEYHFIRVHEKLVQHPINYISNVGQTIKITGIIGKISVINVLYLDTMSGREGTMACLLH